MPYFTDTQIGAEPESIQDYDPSFGLSLGTAVEDAFISNPSKVIYDYTKVRSANQGERLDRTEAEQRVKESGTQVKIPAIGYTREALDMVIERKQDEMTRQSILDRAPSGILPSTTRFTASLLTSILDPINVASAFVPVVGQERYAAMVANASGALGRAGVRFGVGAAEGAVGAALIEPINLALRTQMQDDYSMVDSLINVGFGTALGGGLHVGGGVLKDAYGPRLSELSKASTEDLYAKAEPPDYSSLNVPAVFRKPSADSVAAKISEVSPETRAAGLRVSVAQAMEGRIPDVEAIVQADPRFNSPLTLQEPILSKVQDKTGAELDVSISSQTFGADATQPNSVMVEIKDPVTGDRRGFIDFAVREDGALVSENTKVAETMQGRGMAEAMYKAARDAGFDIAPGRYQTDQGNGMVARLQEKGVINRPAQDIGMRADQASTIDTNKALDMAKETARRATSPESIAVADFAASRAADERLAASPQGDDAAEKALESTMARLDQTIKNLELRGMAPEKVAALREALKPFDEDLKDAQKLGDAARAYVICNL